MPESYDPLVTALENLDEKDISLDLCKQRLLAEEAKRINRMEESMEDTIAAFVGQKKFNGKCRRCGMKGHMAKDCRVKLPGGEANAVVNGRPVSFAVNHAKPEAVSTNVVFFVDSGCSDHLVNNLACLKAVRKLKQPFVVDVAKDDVSLTGFYEGMVEGVTMAGVPVEMKNVVFLPELRGNLLSVKKLSEAGVDVLFTGCRGQEKAVLKFNDAVIAVAYLRNNLYELELEVNMWRGTANLCAAVMGKRSCESFNDGREPVPRPLDECESIDPLTLDGLTQQMMELNLKSQETVMDGCVINGYRLLDRKSVPPLMVQDHCREPEGDQREAVIPAILDAAEVEVPPIEDDIDDDIDGAESCGTDGGAEPDGADRVVQTGGKEDNPGALPSQQRGDGFSEPNTRRSDRERRLPGKFLDFFTYGAHCAVKIFDLADPPLTPNDECLEAGAMSYPQQAFEIEPGRSGISRDVCTGNEARHSTDSVECKVLGRESIQREGE